MMIIINKLLRSYTMILSSLDLSLTLLVPRIALFGLITIVRISASIVVPELSKDFWTASVLAIPHHRFPLRRLSDQDFFTLARLSMSFKSVLAHSWFFIFPASERLTSVSMPLLVKALRRFGYVSLFCEIIKGQCQIKKDNHLKNQERS